MSAVILVVDDEQAIRSALQGLFEDEEYLVTTAASGEEAIAKIRKASYACVLLDIWMPGIDGLETLTRIRQIDQSLPVIMMSGHATIDTAVRATKQGAFDFLEKPLSSDKLLIQVRNAIEKRRLQQQNALMRTQEPKRAMALIGHHPSIVAVRKRITQIASNRSPVLLLGEHGAGKTIAARALHHASGRDGNAWSEVNTAMLDSGRFDALMFGAEKGALPSAANGVKGKLEIAQGGALYLDEVGDLEREAQTSLLNLLQSQRYCRVGSSQTIRLDTRLIIGSSLSLPALQELLREDLFARLSGVSITLPAIHTRSDDIPMLVDHLSKQVAADLGAKGTVKFDASAMKVLQQYRWPGNLREMRNYIERCQILNFGDVESQIVLDSESMPSVVVGAQRGSPSAAICNDSDEATSFAEAKVSFEKAFICRNLDQHDWNISHTAEAIGVERSQLHRKIRALGIVRGDAA